MWVFSTYVTSELDLVPQTAAGTLDRWFHAPSVLSGPSAPSPWGPAPSIRMRGASCMALVEAGPAQPPLRAGWLA